MLRTLLRSIVRLLFMLLSRLDVQGLENIPPTGPSILAANHLGRLDSPLMFSLVDRTDITSLVADKYQHNPLLRPLVNAVHGIWINREQADFRALHQALDYIEGGGMLGIAPEGTRSKTGALMPAKTGVAYLAGHAGVFVVPVGIWGTETAIALLCRLRRPLIHVRIGQPFHLPPLERGDRSASLQKNTAEIMCHIAALLPPAYRGVYAEHPMLRALLEDHRASINFTRSPE
jgi:1-acyl-sn-glycerol-3-phosphate acyltransferase